MIQTSVLVFDMQQNSASGEVQAAYDLRAAPVDLIDTWGPGLLISDADSMRANQVLSIEIGGGLISHLDHKLHWQKMPSNQGLSDILTTSRGFSLASKERIGAVQVNNECPTWRLDRQEPASKACAEYLHPIGTSQPGWVPRTRHAALQIGTQYASANIGVDFEWSEGITVKQRMLQRLKSSRPRIFLEDLEAYYGLEISLCTGVARRIPLRLLLADILPVYVKSDISQLADIWEGFGDELVSAMRGADLSTWVSALEPDHHESMIMLLSDLLIHLEGTGLDSERKLNVAWIRPGQVQDCFKLQCNDQNTWVRILEDTNHCATFACITTACLETNNLRCRGAIPWQWHNVSEALDTEIHRHVTLNSGKVLPPFRPFALQEDSKYWIGPAKAGLVASPVNLAVSPTLEISQDWLHRVPPKHRDLILRRFAREYLRERGAVNGHFVEVTVRAQSRQH